MAFPSVEARIAWRPEQFNRVTNPGFESATTGWSVAAGINGAGTSITRITTDFHSGVASGSLVTPATALTGVNFDFGTDTFFLSGYHFYRFVVWLKSASGTTQARLIVGSEGTSADRASRDISLTNQWQPFFVDWAPTANRTDVQLAIVNIPAVAMTVRIDDVAVYLRDAFTQVENGYFTTDTSGWLTTAGINAAGTSITRQASGGFYGASTGRLVTTATSGSGMNWDLGTRLFTSGRTYRARVYLRSISGSTSARLRLGSLGTPADRGDSTVTITTTWTAYTVNWTPTANRTDAELAVTNGSAAIMTADVDGVEIYEALDDISADAFGQGGGSALSYGRGASFDGSSQAAGFANLRVVNTDGKYSPENTGGVLYGYLEAGKRVLIRATYEGVPYAVFCGSIGRIIPQPMQFAAEIQCRDPIHDFGRKSLHVAESADAYHDARTSALEASDIKNYAAESGPIESLAAYIGTDETGLLSYLDALNAATGSLYFIRPSIYAHIGWEAVFRDRTTHSDPTSTSETWNDDIADLSGYDVTDEALVNRQRVGYAPYDPGSHRPIVQAWVPEDHSIVDDPDGAFYFTEPIFSGTLPMEALPITIPTNEKRVFLFSFNAPVTTMDAIISYSSGTSTTTLDKSSTRAILTLEAGSSAAVVNAIAIRGYPLFELPLNDADRDDEESIWLRGEHQGNPVESRYIQHPHHADGLADWRIWRYKVPRARPTALITNDFVRQLGREVSDRITLNFARLSISGKVFAMHSFSTTVSEGGREWNTTYMLEALPAAPANGWFRLGTSALGGTAVLAY